MGVQTHVWRAGLNLQYLLNWRKMGNLTSSCCNQATSRALDELCDLTAQSYNRSCELSFEPYGFPCCSIFSQIQNSQINSFGIPENSQDKDKSKVMEHQPEGAQESGDAFEPVAQCYTSLMTPLQKNQNHGEKNMKSKPIKKSQRSRKAKISIKSDPEEYLINPEEITVFQHSLTFVEDGIRDQNNCKSYHKLVKNYLMSRGFAHLFDEYGVQYHTRYYFIVALIFIKYYLKEDFNEVYAQIVQQELDAQGKKIERRQKAMEKLKREMNSRNQKETIKKRTYLEMKINHIRVVIHEIEDYSVRSCKAFFSGNTEESLRILYLKDDPIMRKKYYFDSALEFVSQIQNKVRKATSHHT